MGLFVYKLSMIFFRRCLAGWPGVGSASLHLASVERLGLSESTSNGRAAEDSTACPTPLGRERSREWR